MNSHQKEGISYLYMLMEEYKFDRVYFLIVFYLYYKKAYLLLQELKQSEKYIFVKNIKILKNCKVFLIFELQ